MTEEKPPTPNPSCNYDTESRDVAYYEFTAIADGPWLPVTPERAAELRRQLGPAWDQFFSPPADPTM